MKEKSHTYAPYVNQVFLQNPMGTSINDVQRFLVIFDLPTYIVLLYNVQFLGLSWTPLPSTLISDVINGRSLFEETYIISSWRQKVKQMFYLWIKVFWKSNLNLHSASVNEEINAHKCSICESSFSQKTHLKRHMYFISSWRHKGTPLCSNTRMEFKNNSVPLKPKTEFKFDRKDWNNI